MGVAISPNRFFHRKQLWLAGKAVVSLTLLAILLTRVNLPELGYSIGNTRPTSLLLALFIAILSWVVNTYKWQRLLRALGHKLPYASLLGLNFIGLFYSLLLPGQVSGEVVKGIKLGRNGAPTSAVAASITVDRISGVSAICLWAITGLAFSPETGTRAPLLYAAFILLAISSLPLLLSLSKAGEKVLGYGTSSATLIGTVFRTLLSSWRAVAALNDIKLVVVTLLLSLLSQLLVAASNYAVALGVGVDIPFITILWIVSAVSLVHLAPISFAGLGFREGAYVLLLSQQGVSLALGLTLSLAVFSVILAQGLLGGVIELWSNRLGLTKMASTPE